MKKFIFALGVVLVVINIYALATGFIITRTTGILAVSTSDPKSIISVSQPDKAAKVIGQGSARVRLSPGTYRLAASNPGRSVLTTVTIIEKSTLKKSLNITPVDSAEVQRDSLFSRLPVQGPAATYQIDQGVRSSSGGTVFTIIITSATPQDRKAALQWIRDRGYNPSDYKIEYRDASITNYHYTEGLPGSE